MFIKFHFKWIGWFGWCEWEKKDNYDCPLAFASNSALYLFILLWFFLYFSFFSFALILAPWPVADNDQQCSCNFPHFCCVYWCFCCCCALFSLLLLLLCSFSFTFYSQWMRDILLPTVLFQMNCVKCKYFRLFYIHAKFRFHFRYILQLRQRMCTLTKYFDKSMWPLSETNEFRMVYVLGNGLQTCSMYMLWSTVCASEKRDWTTKTNGDERMFCSITRMAKTKWNKVKWNEMSSKTDLWKQKASDSGIYQKRTTAADYTMFALIFISAKPLTARKRIVTTEMVFTRRTLRNG